MGAMGAMGTMGAMRVMLELWELRNDGGAEMGVLGVMWREYRE